MAAHAEDALAGARITQILNLPLAIAALEAGGAKGLVARQDGEVFDLVAAGAAAVGAIVADEGAITEQEEVGVRVEEGAARMAAETGQVPSMAGCNVLASEAVSSGYISMKHTKLECSPLLEYLRAQSATIPVLPGSVSIPRRSPCRGRSHPLPVAIQDS